jgi:hypothetical protein
MRDRNKPRLVVKRSRANGCRHRMFIAKALPDWR